MRDHVGGHLLAEQIMPDIRADVLLETGTTTPVSLPIF